MIGNHTPITFEVDESILQGEVKFASPKENTDVNALLYNIVKAAVKEKSGKRNVFDDIKDTIIKDLKGTDTTEVNFNYNKGTVPNATTAYIRQLYPTVNFPKDVDFPILLVDGLEGVSDYGTLQGKHRLLGNKEVYVVKNDRISISKLANHLRVRSLIEGKSKIINNLDKDLLEELDIISKYLKVSREQLLVDYLQDPSKYNHLKEPITTQNRTPKFVLEEASNIINESEGIPRYKKENQILNEFCASINIGSANTYVDLGQFLSYTQKIKFMSHIKTIKSFLETFNKKASQLDISEWKPSNDLEERFIEVFNNRLQKAEDDYPGLSLFVESLFDLRGVDEPLFRYEANGTTKVKNSNGILLKKKFPSFNSIYGTTYQDFDNSVPVKTVGSHTIFTFKQGDATLYIVARHLPNEYSEAVTFTSQEDAEKYADKLRLKETLREGAVGNLKNVDSPEKDGRTFESPDYHPANTYIKSLAININFDNFYNQEQTLLDKPLSDFYKYLEELDSNSASTLITKLDSAEKAVAFLSKINQPGFIRTSGNFIKAAEEIEQLGYKYYYIRASYKLQNGNYRNHFIPVPNAENMIVDNPSPDPKIPIITQLDAIAEVMQNKFGVKVNVMTQSEINDEMDKEDGIFKGQEFNEGTKAFIYNGEIYVNSTYATDRDLFHEYAHLFMGVLKSRNKEWYVQTLNAILELSPYAQEQLQEKMKSLGRSYYDSAEEVFADLYGKYLQNNLPRQLEHIFDNDILKSVTHSIFDLADSEADINDFLKYGRLSNLFMRFNSDIALAFSKNKNFLHDDQLTLQRRKQNWIEQQLKLYKQQKEAGVKDEENEGLKEEC